MTDEKRSISAPKKLLALGYATALGAHALASAFTSGGRGAPRVFYGGALAGDVGGPLVKVSRLTRYFPQHLWNYNLVYCLSNAPYLPGLALAVLAARRTPIVHNQNGVFYPAWFEGDWKAGNARMARTYMRAEHVFWQSEFCRRAADEFLGRRQGSGEILHNAIDTGRFTPPERAPEGPVVFLLTGKMDAHLFYRIESALVSFAAVVARGLDARLRLVGWSPPVVDARVRSLAGRLGIAGRVEMAGRYTQVEAPGIYRSAHVYVSTKHNDACPNAVIEAMACGLPVVYSVSGGVPELVGEAGIGVDVQESWDVPQVPDPDALADAMLRAANDRAVLGARARARAVERFDIAHWVARHRAVFEDLTR